MAMNLNQAAGLQGMLKGGHTHAEGIDEAVSKNIDACRKLSTMTRSSLGPNGMNKLVINHLEKIFVTSDTFTIISELEVAHPAANMIVMAAKMQEQEVGDGTNFVVTFAGEVVAAAEELLRMGLHTSEIIAGYKRASKYALDYLQKLCIHTVEDVTNQAEIVKVVRSVLAAKQYGYEDVLAPFVAEACLSVLQKNNTINIESVRVCKCMGGSIHDSEVIKGLVITRGTEGSIKFVEKPKVVVFAIGIESSSTEAKGTVLIKNSDELLNFNKSEETTMEDSIKAIRDAGCNVIVAGGSISELAMHFIEKYKMMAIKIQSKFELRRVCKTLHATALIRLGAPSPDEIGFCSSIEVREIGGRKHTILCQEEEQSKVATVVLRAATSSALNDLERAIDDGVSCVKQMVIDQRFVAGAGACELELCRELRKFGESTPGLDQYAIIKFAEAFEIVPRTLAENSGQVAHDMVTKLIAAHANGQTTAGLNVEEAGGILCAKEACIFDSYSTKYSAIQLASNVAITVLSVDQIIMAKAAGGPKIPVK